MLVQSEPSYCTSSWCDRAMLLGRAGKQNDSCPGPFRIAASSWDRNILGDRRFLSAEMSDAPPRLPGDGKIYPIYGCREVRCCIVVFPESLFAVGTVLP